jgi:hypothetical protein
LKMQNLTPAEIIEEALKLPLSEQEEVVNRLTYSILGELQALGYEDQSGRQAR